MSQCAYSLDAVSWTDLPVGPQFDLGIGIDEENIQFLTDGGKTWEERLFERDGLSLTFKIKTSHIPSFQALQDAVDGGLNRFFFTLDRTADPIVAVYGWKQAGFVLSGTGEPVQPPVYNFQLNISGEEMSILALLRSYDFADLPADPAAGALAMVSDAPGGIWSYSGTQWVRRDEGINVKDAPFNALGNGTDEDTAAFDAAFLAASTYGGVVIIPEGTYVLSDFDIPSNITVRGAGIGRTILIAKSSAVLTKLVTIPNTSSEICIRDLTIDGNRDGAGMLDGLSSPLHIGGSRVNVENCEIKNGTRIGVFIGNDSVSAGKVTFRKCYVHDNGGVVDDTGYGVGIQSGGTVSPEDIEILDCQIDSNYNTVTKPGDSNGIKLEVRGVLIRGCKLNDNYNVAGGQIVIHGDNVENICDADIISNTIRSTTNYGTPTDRTEGIEIQGMRFSIIDNDMYLSNTDANGISVNTEPVADGGFGRIIGNHIEGCGQGIALSDNTPIRNVVISENYVNAIIGIAMDDTHSNIQIFDNNLADCGQPFAGLPSSTTLMDRNLPLAVSNSANGRTHTQAVGVDSAAHLVLGNGNSNQVAGTIDVELIDSTGWGVGDVVTLYFTDTLTLKYNQAPSGAFKPILLNGLADLVVNAFAAVMLVYTGADWEQTLGNNA